MSTLSYLFIDEFQFDQRIGNGLRTDLDRKLFSNFFESGIRSFGHDILEKLVMGFEFRLGAGVRFDGGNDSGCSNLSLEFGNERLRNVPFFGSGRPRLPAVQVLENTFAHFAGDGLHEKSPEKNKHPVNNAMITNNQN